MIPLFFGIVGTVGMNRTHEVIEYKHAYVKHWIINKGLSYVNEARATRYADVIMANSEKYDLPFMALTRQVWEESRFKYWAKSSAGAVGPMQVTPKFWSHILYIIDNGNLGKRLKRKICQTAA